jgi:hypothetical protein
MTPSYSVLQRKNHLKGTSCYNGHSKQLAGDCLLGSFLMVGNGKEIHIQLQEGTTLKETTAVENKI